MGKFVYEPRWYRNQLHTSELYSFSVSYQETDLWIGVDPTAYIPELQQAALRQIITLRHELDAYIEQDTIFLRTLSPHQPLPACPPIARQMCNAALLASVGPMAAVAGAFSQLVAHQLIAQFALTELIIENGGDIYLHASQCRRIAIFAGASPLSNKLGLEVDPSLSPLGICTSSGTVGHSLSFGKADAVTILAQDAAVADAYATALGNMIQSPASIDAALAYAATQPEILGTVIIVGDRIGFQGNVKLIKV
jgi:hypothetical protein